MDQTAGFIEEIEFEELKFGEIVGRGAFGVVSRAVWRGIDVAVKHIETESEKKAFKTELTQLSRVVHRNIVKLYGACTKQPVCLVMEYAEGGSLYNVLHGEGPQPSYTAAHAMSWNLQCAQGVAYLHGMKPKPLIHRDLKPPNLLLIAGGTILKICDFGTACDAHTHMTNNKGSAAWMAPEVFEGSNYSEKCDVFSWGIILWEVITRRKPFDEIGGPAFRIMWAVHNGKRPPLIQGFPKPLEILMTRCWSANPVERPSMAEVTRIMLHLFQFFKGAEIPLQYPQLDEAEGYYETASLVETPPTTNQSQDSAQLTAESRGSTIRDTVRQALLGDAVPIKHTPPRAKPVVIEEGDHHRRTSAPASLAASRESLLDKSSRSSTPIEAIKRYSADLSRLGEVDLVAQGAQIAPNQQPFVRGHRRSGSYGNSPIVTSSLDQAGSTSATSSPAKSMHRSVTEPDQLDESKGSSWEPGAPIDLSVLNLGVLGMNSSEQAACNLDLQALDHQLQPLAPSPKSQESMSIFQQHLQLAQRYIRVQAEVRLLEDRKHQLLQEAEQDVETKHSQPRLVEEYQQLMTENDQLLMLQRNLKKQAEVIRKQQARRTGNT